MGIYADNGYIYFNELLYKSMKRVYGRSSNPLKPVSSTLQAFELKTQYKLLLLTLASSKQSRVIHAAEVYQLMVGRTQSVNPFLTVMYLNISFREWLS